MRQRIMSRLPIEDVLPALCEALANGRNALLTAPPGAGKTTRVPLALLAASWLCDKKILLLEPRRLAARAAAHRMASLVGETIGETVGYRMRLDTKVGPNTRIEVVTEGILTRLLQHDPSLTPYGIVLFDEFHERSLHGDTGLTLSLETQRLFRSDLRLLVMSATLDCGPVSDFLEQAPVITCVGQTFPVETRYLDRPLTGRLDAAVTQIIRRSLAQDSGSLLVFLPGMAEILRVADNLRDADLGLDVMVAPLHGNLPQEAQDLAIAPPPPGMRKVVLATSIAETSLTINGVRVVIDAGQSRVPRFDPRSGLTRLATIRVTQDSAEQRRGRAGRLEPGICYRLWTERDQIALTARRSPEIMDADLSPLLLDLAVCGTTNPDELSWLTTPPSGSISQARELLRRLSALDRAGHITSHGRLMGGLSMHPRLSHMLLRAGPMGLSHLACEVAALLSESDVFRWSPGWRNADLRLRLDILHGHGEYVAGATVDHGACHRVKRTADAWRRQLAPQPRTSQLPQQQDTHLTGLLLALAYPDRIAQRQPGGEPRYLLANGRGALFTTPDPLTSEPYLVIAELDAGTQWGRIDIAAPISLEQIESLYASEITQTESVNWDEKTRAVRASTKRQFGALVLSEQTLSNPDPVSISTALLEGVRRTGLSTLPWTPDLKQWRARVQFLKRAEGPASLWPDLSDEALLRTLDQWLGPYLHGLTTLASVTRLDLSRPLKALLAHEQRHQLDLKAPTHLIVPSGSRVRVEYDSPDLPILAVPLQEMFGCEATPRLVDGTVPVVVHLLSPAKRPVQVTKDLASFWTTTYQAVRKELRGRYPKHYWPEDPLTALPTTKLKRHKP